MLPEIQVDGQEVDASYGEHSSRGVKPWRKKRRREKRSGKERGGRGMRGREE